MGASAGLLAAAPAIGVLSACQPAPGAPDKPGLQHIDFTLPWIPTGEVAFFYVAKQFGYWEEHGLDVSIERGFGSGTAANQVGLNQFQFGQAGIPAVLATMIDGLDLISIGVTSPKDPAGIFSLQEQNITQPKDLEGKRLGATVGSATEVLLSAFLAINEVDRDAVIEVNMSGDVMLQALLQGEIDAATTLLQNGGPPLIVDGVPYNAMLFADHGLDLYSLSMITQRRLVEEQPEVVRGFIDGTMRALKHSYLNPVEANDIFLEMVPEAGQTEVDREMNLLSLLVNNAMGFVPSFEEHGLGYHDIDIMRNTVDTLAAALDWSDPPDPETSMTNDFVGHVTLTPEEWATARELASQFVS